MSHTSSGAPDQRNYKRATIGNVFASTPIGKAAVRFRSTSSLSRIDTASSSSGGRIKGRLQSQTARKTTKGRKKALKNKSQLDKKRRRVNQSNDTKQLTSSQWETESEESIEEVITDSRASILEENDDARINLFDDPSTPEEVRDAPILHESPLHHSPILPSRRSGRFHLISKESNIVQRDKLLPVNIPLSEARNPNETDEDEIILKRTSEVKTYPAHRPARFAENSSLRENSLETYFNFSYPPEYYTTIFTMESDLLWEKFVEENREEFPYLAPSSARKPVKKYESEFLRKFPDIPPKFEDVPIPLGMICIHGYSDRKSQKWKTYIESNEEDDVRQTKADKKGKRKRKERTLSVWDETDVYHLLNETVDDEFETGGKDGKRISFSEFRQKRKRMMNTVSGKLSSVSSHSSQTQ